VTVESADLNDSDILTQTTQKTDGNSNVQFFYTLPSGRKINSEWVSPDNRKKALLSWVEVIRTSIVDDVKKTRREKIEAAQAAAPKIVIPSVAAGNVAPYNDVIPELPAPVEVTYDDPLEHAQAQYKAAVKLHMQAAEELQFAETQLDAARKAMRRWHKIVTALEATGDEDGEEDGR
jgi:hypothetical protein